MNTNGKKLQSVNIIVMKCSSSPNVVVAAVRPSIPDEACAEFVQELYYTF